MEFKSLYQELTHSTETLRAMLSGVGGEKARLKPAKGAWSVLEVTCHLYDEEREDFREHLDFILHRQHEEWHVITPKVWVKQRKYNEQDFGKMKAKFFRERMKSLAWLKGLKNTDWNITYKSKFGSMRAGDMFAAWVAHDNLHIRQLVELRRWHIERISKPYRIQYAGDW